MNTLNMNRIVSLVFFSLILTPNLFAQHNPNYADFTGAIGKNQGSLSLSYFTIWQVGKSKKIEAGLGARFTTYIGSAQYFSSAPASLAGDEKKSDSLLLQSPQINALNLAIHLGYKFSPKFSAGFTIDAVGFSFGSQKNGVYINGNAGQTVNAKPTLFNVLLIGNNDRGSLNSEFFVRYFFSEKLALKIAYQYLFVEYTTKTKVQQTPELNDRFRNKASLISVGITKQF
jgi:long-subunit fatty acid transport protein